MCHIYSNVCCKRHLDQASVFCCDYTALVHVVEVWFCVIQCISYLSVFSIHWHVLSCLTVIWTKPVYSIDQCAVFVYMNL